jgi:hypothetical protein
MCRAGGLVGSEVAFVSIHGTGTPLGDPIEAGALGQALGSGSGGRKHQLGSSKRQLAAVSSKACYGHTEGTAGLAGLLLALQVGKLFITNGCSLHGISKANILRPWLCKESWTRSSTPMALVLGDTFPLIAA